MSARLPRPSLQALQWLAVLGPPLAWAAQFVVGYGFGETACSAGGRRWGISVDAWTAGLTAAAALVALGGGAAALTVFRQTREARGEGGSEEDPPLGRLHFLATIGLVTAPLFLIAIVMGGVGAIVLPDCRQA